MELLSTTAVALVLASGTPISDPLLERALEASRAECAALGGEVLRYDDETLATLVDLTGDGSADDRLVSEASAFCGPDQGYLHGGSGGAPLHAVIGDQVQSLPWGGWSVVDAPFTFAGDRGEPLRLLLVGMHGLGCDSFGAAPCVLALAWDGTRLISVLDAIDIWAAETDDEDDQ